MAKSAKNKEDFSKNIEDVKKQLMKFGQEALVLVKKGEEEIVRLSKEGKVRLDATTVGLKQEHLLYLIGKEYVRSGCPGTKNAKIKKLIKELEGLRKTETSLKRTIKKFKK